MHEAEEEVVASLAVSSASLLFVRSCTSSRSCQYARPHLGIGRSLAHASMVSRQERNSISLPSGDQRRSLCASCEHQRLRWLSAAGCPPGVRVRGARPRHQSAATRNTSVLNELLSKARPSTPHHMLTTGRVLLSGPVLLRAAEHHSMPCAATGFAGFKDSLSNPACCGKWRSCKLNAVSRTIQVPSIVSTFHRRIPSCRSDDPSANPKSAGPASR